MRPAVFLDRDGTLIELVHHLTDPADVQLLPRAAEAVLALREHGYACVLVTNQSVIGRGKLTIDGLELVHAELASQLGRHDTALDGIYFCPIAPISDDPQVVEHPDRKPGPGMLLRAAGELQLDLGRSWMIGDTVSDVLAGRNAGCAGTILVKSGYGRERNDTDTVADHMVDDLWAASQLIIQTDMVRDGTSAIRGGS